MFSSDQLYRRLMARKVPFFIVFFLVVLLTYALLYVLDFYPEPIEEADMATLEQSETVEIDPFEAVDNEVAAETVSETMTLPVTGIGAATPTMIIFDTLNRSVPVSNPQSRQVAVLDEALLSGAVRHPDSADFTEAGNMFILGHSSYLPNVFNKNFQSFNGIQELTWGDKIRVQSADMEYVYRVEKVYKARATEVVVPHTPGEAKLTLATCNSFGSKDDRFMVEAKLVGKNPL